MLIARALAHKVYPPVCVLNKPCGLLNMYTLMDTTEVNSYWCDFRNLSKNICIVILAVSY